MAPKYKLTYFAFRGFAEPIRFLLAYGNLEFDDIRFTWDDWPNLKPNMPFGKVPILEVNGQPIYQSVSICRYLAEELNLAGRNNWENLQLNCIIDTIVDLRNAYYNFNYEPNETAKAQKLELLLNETTPFYLSRLDKIVEDNEGYFFKGRLTWVDIYYAAIHECLVKMVPKDLFSEQPNLKRLVEKVQAIPQIKAWIEKRPQDAC